jgi:hypothetical protein
VLSRATRLIPGQQSRAAAPPAGETPSWGGIADLDCRRNYGFGAALAVVFRKPAVR